MKFRFSTSLFFISLLICSGPVPVHADPLQVEVALQVVQGAAAVTSEKSGEETSPPIIEKPKPQQPIKIRVNLPATRLDFYVKDKLQKSYKVAIGTPKYPTPLRKFNMSQIIWNPWWLPPDSDWAQDAEKTPPGPGNPLGPVKMMMEAGIRIHGTTASRSIGRASSHACLRMYSNEAQELAWEVQKRYTSKTDEKYLDKYKRNRRRSYYVNLWESVPIYMDYHQVERHGDELWLHPNRYWRKGFRQQLEKAVADQEEIAVTQALVKRLDKMRRRKSVRVSLAQVKAWSPKPPTASLDAANQVQLEAKGI